VRRRRLKIYISLFYVDKYFINIGVSIYKID
jgi:hypothetical protein